MNYLLRPFSDTKLTQTLDYSPGTQPAAFFAAHGITVKAVLTDNGSCYRSRTFAAALGPHLKHRRTRPYRPHLCHDASLRCPHFKH